MAIKKAYVPKNQQEAVELKKQEIKEAVYPKLEQYGLDKETVDRIIDEAITFPTINKTNDDIYHTGATLTAKERAKLIYRGLYSDVFIGHYAVHHRMLRRRGWRGRIEFLKDGRVVMRSLHNLLRNMKKPFKETLDSEDAGKVAVAVTAFLKEKNIQTALALLVVMPHVSLLTDTPHHPTVSRRSSPGRSPAGLRWWDLLQCRG